MQLYLPPKMAIGIGFVAIFRAISNQIQRHQREKSFELEQIAIKDNLSQLQNLQKLLETKAKNIQINYLAPPLQSNILSISSIKQIFKTASQLISSSELNEIYEKNRLARRSIFHACFIGKQVAHSERLQQKQLYYRFICTFEEQINYLIERTQKDLLAFLDIRHQILNESVDYHLDAQNQEFTEYIEKWTIEVKQNLKIMLTKYDSPTSNAQIIELLEMQINQVRSNCELLKQTIQNLKLSSQEQKQGIKAFLDCYLQDLTYQKSGIEVQQMNVGEDQLEVDAIIDKIDELKQLKKQLQEAIMEQVEQNQLYSYDLDDSNYF